MVYSLWMETESDQVLGILCGSFYITSEPEARTVVPIALVPVLDHLPALLGFNTPSTRQ